MLAHMPSRERFAIYAIAAIVLMGLGYLGSSALKRSDPVTVVEESSTVADSAPAPKSKEATAAPTVTELVVHVAGAVKRPQVAHLKPDARVQDAIDAAGGSGPDADLEAINLAAKIEDGSQVFVPRKGKPEETTKVSESYRGGAGAPNRYAAGPSATSPVSTASHSNAKKQPSGPVSLNNATEAQLETLPGVGPATAQKILDYRKEHGAFSAVEEIMAVKGIGPKKYEKMRQWLKL